MNLHSEMTNTNYMKINLTSNTSVLLSRIVELEHLKIGKKYTILKENRVVYNPRKIEWLGYNSIDFKGELIELNHYIYYHESNITQSDIFLTFKLPHNVWETETYYYRTYTDYGFNQTSDNFVDSPTPDISIDEYLGLFNEYIQRDTLMSG